jgi:uncharacterized protein (TIGR00725 family)
LYISVCGASQCDEELESLAYRAGLEISRRGHILVCGGLTGVMDAAARGCRDGGGTSIGILPGPDRGGSSQWLSVSIPTDMGHARNVLVARAGDAVVAVGGGYGTLSEIAFALKMGKPVVGLGTWRLEKRGPAGIEEAESPEEAVALAERIASA